MRDLKLRAVGMSGGSFSWARYNDVMTRIDMERRAEEDEAALEYELAIIREQVAEIGGVEDNEDIAALEGWLRRGECK